MKPVLPELFAKTKLPEVQQAAVLDQDFSDRGYQPRQRTTWPIYWAYIPCIGRSEDVRQLWSFFSVQKGFHQEPMPPILLKFTNEAVLHPSKTQLHTYPGLLCTNSLTGEY